MVLSENRLTEILANIAGKSIAVIGDTMLDNYLWGDAIRISPEAPVPVVKLEREEIRIGGAANVADNVNVLGARPILLSIIGDDEPGRKLLARAHDLDLETSEIIIDENRQTTVKTRIVARHQQVCRVDRETVSDIEGKTLEALLNAFNNVSSVIDAVIISDYGKGVVTPRMVGQIVDSCCSYGFFIAVDPKEQHWEYYSGVDLIKPNHHETARATGIDTCDERGIENAGWRLLDITGAKSALVTTGERGMSLFEPGRNVKHLPTMARDVFDVTGAGDTVVAASTAAIVGGATLEEAAIIANHAAGVVVAEVGTAVATPAQIAASMTRERDKS